MPTQVEKQIGSWESSHPSFHQARSTYRARTKKERAADRRSVVATGVSTDQWNSAKHVCESTILPETTDPKAARSQLLIERRSQSERETEDTSDSPVDLEETMDSDQPEETSAYGSPSSPKRRIWTSSPIYRHLRKEVSIGTIRDNTKWGIKPKMSSVESISFRFPLGIFISGLTSFDCWLIPLHWPFYGRKHLRRRLLFFLNWTLVVFIKRLLFISKS